MLGEFIQHTLAPKNKFLVFTGPWMDRAAWFWGKRIGLAV